MMTAFLTGTANGFDVELAKVLSENGFKVYAGNCGGEAALYAESVCFDADSAESIEKACAELLESCGCIDLYIDTSNYKPDCDKFTVSNDSDGEDYDLMKEIYTANVLRPIALYEGFLPLVSNGELKRYCFITSADASVNMCGDISGYGYNMSKAGLHNFLQIIKNKLMPEGYTFRAFDPSVSVSEGELSDEVAAKSAFNYFTRRRGGEGGRDDETKLVIRDVFGRQRSW